MQTEWRIPESSPFFMVSAKGDVKVRDTNVPARKGDNGRGYLQVQIMREGKRYTRYVHRLVAECFLPNPNGYNEINHIDGNKSNNSVENLEWCTHSENMYHAFRIGLRPMTTPSQRAAAKKTAEERRAARQAGWLRWSKTEKVRQCWLKNLEKADRWGKKKAKGESE